MILVTALCSEPSEGESRQVVMSPRRFLKQFAKPKAKPTPETEALRKLANMPVEVEVEDQPEDSAPVKGSETKVFRPDPERKLLPIEKARIPPGRINED